MNTTLIVCATIVIGLIVIGMFGTICFTSLLRFKHEEMRAYRVWLQILLDQFYNRVDKWVESLSD